MSRVCNTNNFKACRKYHNDIVFMVIALLMGTLFANAQEPDSSKMCGGYDAIEVKYTGIGHHVTYSEAPGMLSQLSTIQIDIARDQAAPISEFVYRFGGNISWVSICLNGERLSDQKMVHVSNDQFRTLNIMAIKEDKTKIEDMINSHRAVLMLGSNGGK